MFSLLAVFMQLADICSLFFQNSGYASSEVPDDKALIGFAQISITD
jgi:hypothetical protein